MDSGMAVVVDGVSKRFRSPGGANTAALHDVSFQVPEGSLTCVLGPSGCGKSTLLRIIAGLSSPDAGTILVGGEVVSGPDARRGMLFQDYALFPWRTVQKNVEFGLEVRGVGQKTRAGTAAHYIDMVGLTGFEEYFPHQLSGGMRQRAAVARVLANDPEVILMDEPFGSLDAQTRGAMQEQFLDLHEMTKKTVLLVTHSVDEALILGWDVVVLSRRPGRIKDIVTVRDGSQLAGQEPPGLKQRILGLIDRDGVIRGRSGAPAVT